MNRTVGVLLLLLASASLASGQTVSDAEKSEGFVPLFNGTDLTGWLPSPAPTWEVHDGVLECVGGSGPWIRTEKEYENFILRLEYKISPKGNSGVFIRCAPTGRSSRTGLEIQILDDSGRPPNRSSSGSLYDVRAPDKNMSKPAGEWNQVEVTCKGRQVQVAINGEKVHDVSMDDPALNPRPEEVARITETDPNKVPGYLAAPLAKRRQKGHIGLQNHSNPVWFRNIRVRALD